jgi:HAD domain in Swiss Army Knife RNA repair proteins
MGMKAIFLDIDGVLNCKKTPNPRKLPYIVDPNLLKNLEAVLERTGAKVVLSSTWRYDPAGLFSARHWGIPFVGVTPDLPKQPRRNEVLSWLKDHPDVNRYAVIDDEDDELDDLPLFQPSAKTGLTLEIATGVADYLEGKTDRDLRCVRMTRIFQNIYASLRQHQG